ncbi:hypothetical protein GCM10022233_42500 [Streptomyces shaanxiensis]|uniref:Uncharacterized protein n=1 Tax=Streptomyces shaanxiensis TaxID=653357 RepID=A0ABP7VBU3_9ACTN
MPYRGGSPDCPLGTTHPPKEKHVSLPPNSSDPSREPVININVRGDARFSLTASIAQADHGSTSQAAALENPKTPVEAPFWHRTAVIWSALAALAAIAGVVVTWLVKSAA